MDVFKVHRDLLHDYRAFTSGAVDIRDERIKDEVQQSLDDGDQWPDPWLSLNPSFASGGQVSDLVDRGLLHPECRRIFLKDKPKDSFQGKILSLYQHQRDAIDAARTGQSYVLTTGTGSGKSLALLHRSRRRHVHHGQLPSVPEQRSRPVRSDQTADP